jgi:hypothetical protein
MPWINNEDMAIKYKLQGLTVVDANNPARPVPVRFRLPEDELASLTYPCIIIEHQGLFPAPEREHSGEIQLGYAPEVQNLTNNVPNGTWTSLPIWWADTPTVVGNTSWNPPNTGIVGPYTSSPYSSWFPTPYNFDYTITVYARKMPGHLQNIMAMLASATYIPHHFGYLNIPQDGTQRKMFLIGGPEIEYGKDNNDKRLLRAIYRVRVESELVLAQSLTINGPYGGIATQIDVDLGCYTDVTDLTTEEVSCNFGVISAGPSTYWKVYNIEEPVGTYPEGNIQPLPIFRPRRPQRGITQGTRYNQASNASTTEE